ncbi:unnamed protein product [Arabidopsis halleri]
MYDKFKIYISSINLKSFKERYTTGEILKLLDFITIIIYFLGFYNTNNLANEII